MAIAIDRRDSHDTCSGASLQRGLHEVDMSTSLFPEIVPWIDANPEHRRLKFCTRALYCFFVVRHVGTSTARHARHVVPVVSCRDVTQQAEFWLYYTPNMAAFTTVYRMTSLSSMYTHIRVRDVAHNVSVDSKSSRIEFRRHDSGDLEADWMFTPWLTAVPVRHPSEYVSCHHRAVYNHTPISEFIRT